MPAICRQGILSDQDVAVIAIEQVDDCRARMVSLSQTTCERRVGSVGSLFARLGA